MPQDTRTALLDHAEFAARSRGFDGFSYADLAREVGIRKASIHYHFPTKADLSEALIDRYHTSFAQTCTGIDAAHSTAAGRLRALITIYRAALNGGQTLCLCVALTTGRESLSEPAMDKVRAFRSMMTGWLASVFELAQEDGTIAHVSQPDLEAAAALAVLEGALVAGRAQEDPKTFDRVTALLLARCKKE